MLDRTDSRNRYEERLKRVVHHMHDHLDRELDLLELADVAAMSPYHWHRIYNAFFSETIFQTATRLKLHRAAMDLINGNQPMTKIAKRAGYASLPPFSRAFVKAYGTPPGRYRTNMQPIARDPGILPRRTTMQTIEIRQEDGFRVAAIPHQGDYMNISRAFMELYGTLGSRQLMHPDMKMRGIYFDDPGSVPEPDRRSLAGVTVSEDFPLQAPLQEYRMPPTRIAVLTHKGPYAELKASYDYLYGLWLPSSGEEAADLPPFEAYLNTPQDTAPADLLTEICVPLKD
jgi:AraC family transcriptional regulator